jgi:phage FluMu protein Com
LHKVFTVTKFEEKPEIRCGHCGRLLGKGDIVHVEIKCPRCGTLNQITRSADSAKPGRPGVSIRDFHV